MKKVAKYMPTMFCESTGHGLADHLITGMVKGAMIGASIEMLFKGMCYLYGSKSLPPAWLTIPCALIGVALDKLKAIDIAEAGKPVQNVSILHTDLIKGAIVGVFLELLISLAVTATGRESFSSGELIFAFALVGAVLNRIGSFDEPQHSMPALRNNG